VRYAARRGWELCPNYFLAERALELAERDLYAASELARMIPVGSAEHDAVLRAANRWTLGYLPNARAAPSLVALDGPPTERARRWAELALRSPVGAALEGWEQRRKVARFRARARRAGAVDGEASFGPDRCKGHFDANRVRIRAAYEARARGAGVEPIW
jgi:hypothetical protein